MEDIAHVINYDLPEVAENFIHRVGRTGRAGRLGLASTLFAPDQRTELFQLERTLGIRIEKIRPGVSTKEIEAQNRDEFASKVARTPTPPTRRSVQLPGEILQTHMAV